LTIHIKKGKIIGKYRICPIGMEGYKEITVTRQVVKGGKSKYYLNGSTATTEKIRQLFQSVQLNVNNPHFLIMQGKVTQVAKMKPKELLSLLEEAAGIAFYESKKRVAEGTIEKKNRKLQEIEILSGPIQEKIEKHRKEKEMLAQHRANEEELGRIRRILTAHKYFEITHLVSTQGTGLKELRAKIGEVTSEMGYTERKHEQIIKELEDQKLKQAPEINQEIETYRALVKAAQYEHNSIAAEVSKKEKELIQEHNDLANYEQEIEELKEARVKRIKECGELKVCIGRYETELEQKKQYKKALEEQVSYGNGSAMLERIEKLKEHLNALSEELKVKKNRVQVLQQQREELKIKVLSQKANLEAFDNAKQALTKELEKITQHINNAEIDITDQRKVAEEIELKKKLQEYVEKFNNLQSRCYFDINVIL